MIELNMAKFNVKNPQTGEFEPLDGASQAKVHADWNQTDNTREDFIKNKPAPATVDQTYDSTSTNAQSGVAISQALGTIPSVTVDQTYDSTSANPQSGVAIAGVIGNINSVLEEVL